MMAGVRHPIETALCAQFTTIARGFVGSLKWAPMNALPRDRRTNKVKCAGAKILARRSLQLTAFVLVYLGRLVELY